MVFTAHAAFLHFSCSIVDHSVPAEQAVWASNFTVCVLLAHRTHLCLTDTWHDPEWIVGLIAAWAPKSRDRAGRNKKRAAAQISDGDMPAGLCRVHTRHGMACLDQNPRQDGSASVEAYLEVGRYRPAAPTSTPAPSRRPRPRPCAAADFQAVLTVFISILYCIMLDDAKQSQATTRCYGSVSFLSLVSGCK